MELRERSREFTLVDYVVEFDRIWPRTSPPERAGIKTEINPRRGSIMNKAIEGSKENPLTRERVIRKVRCSIRFMSP
jgi:hypothetical protein